jgi:hypothetical protein
MKKLLFPLVWLFVFSAISCHTKTNKSEVVNEQNWMSRADSLVARTFDTLRNTLLQTISEKGFAGAVNFCNTEALNLTNAYREQGVTIKRTSDKIRNPGNAPDKMEQEIIDGYIQKIIKETDLKSVLKKDEAGNYHYFKPILIQAMCLNCHGEKLTQIKPDTWETIRQHYPADSAFNYKEGDLRGIWHVVFFKKNK